MLRMFGDVTLLICCWMFILLLLLLSWSSSCPAVLVLGYSLLASTRMVTASGTIHSTALANIMRAPMSFFDTTPSGRIINRFSSDVATVDLTLPQTLRLGVMQLFSVLSTFVVISYSTPIFLVVILPLAVVYYVIQVSWPRFQSLLRLRPQRAGWLAGDSSDVVAF